MAGIPANPNVSPNVWTPDTYIYISTQPVSTGSRQPKNLFLLAPYVNSAAAMVASPYSLTAGTAQVNSVEQYTSVDRVNSSFHRRSLMANAFRGSLQTQPIGLNIYCAAVAEPTASNFTGVATQLLIWEGTAVGSGEIKVRVKGFLHRIPIASGDTAAVAAATCRTAMGGTGGGTSPQQPDCPFVPGAALSNDPFAACTTVPLVCVSRGEVGNSKPVVVDIPPEITGLKIGVGNIAIGTNAAGAAGSPSLFTIRCGALAVTVSIAIGTTPDNAAIAIAAAINAATFGLTATRVTTNVQLYYRSGWAVHRVQVNSTEDALGQIYTLRDRMNATHAATDPVATVPASVAYTALQGAGTPTLTTVLSNRLKTATMLEWYSEYNDSTSLGDCYTHIEQYANGYYQENQRLTFGSDEVLDTSGTALKNAKQRLTDPSTPLTNSWRYCEVVEQDCFSGISNMAVELAADLCAKDLPYNLDGHALAQGTQAPVLVARGDTELDPGTQDVAMRTYHLTPVRGVNGVPTITRGVTSWGASNTEWSDLSYGRIFDDSRYRIRSFFNQRFSGKVLFTGTAPRVDNAFTLEDVEDAGREWLLSRDGITVDGARELARYVRAELDPDDQTFIRFALRLRPPREAHVKSGTLSSAPPLA
jgi:hypothetical protein